MEETVWRSGLKTAVYHMSAFGIFLTPVLDKQKLILFKTSWWALRRDETNCIELYSQLYRIRLKEANGRRIKYCEREKDDGGILMVIDGEGWLGQSTRQACFSLVTDAQPQGMAPFVTTSKNIHNTTWSEILTSEQILQRPMGSQEQANQPFLDESDQKTVNRFETLSEFGYW